MKTLYYGGHIITMENENDNPEAILVNNDTGKIAAVGLLDSLSDQIDDQTQKVNLNGRCLMPAFIDSHSHILMNGQMSQFADLSSCQSFDDIIHVLQQYIQTNSVASEKAVMGYGYDHNFLKEQQHPDKRVLDQVSKTIPVMILHISGHLACVNSAALQLAGIHESTPDPQGGIIGRVKDSMEPSGYLEESGTALIQKHLSSRISMNLSSIQDHMQDTYIEHGITTVQEGAATLDGLNILSRMSKAGKLKVDVIAYPLMSENKRDFLPEDDCITGNYVNHLKMGGYKIILDGSPQGRSAWLSKPYEQSENGYCGYPWISDEILRKYIEMAVQDHQQILVHCNGDAASEQFLDIYEQVINNHDNIPELRPVMIHCQTVRNDQLDRMAKLGMIASVFVGHVWYWGDVHLINLGKERGHHISPVKDALNRNIIVNFHQDTPVTKPDMLHSVWCAVNRISRNGNLIGPDQKISVYEALKAVTRNAAYQYFEEQEKGSLKAGKIADLVILDSSPLKVAPEQLNTIKVLETIKDGKTIWHADINKNKNGDNK